MVRGLFTPLQFPYAQFPISNDLMYEPFWEAVSRIERLVRNTVDYHVHKLYYTYCYYRCGLEVVGVTCDGNSANRRF